MSKALLVVDVQSYFLKESPKELPELISAHIKINKYDLVAFTIFKGEKNSNYEKTLNWSSCQNAEDLVLPDVLTEFVSTDNVFTKGSYSAFYGGELDKYFKNSDIKSLDICGIDLDACVLATAYGAFDLGYDTKVLFELCHSRFEHDDTLQEIINRNIQSKNESR